VERADASGAQAFLFCNLSGDSRDLRVPYTASGAKLELFTGEQRFGGAPATGAPPNTLNLSQTTIVLAPFSAALYLKSGGVTAMRIA